MFAIMIRPFGQWKIFIWYVDHWITPGLEAVVRGGGIRGYLKFYYSLLKCIFGYHSFVGCFRMDLWMRTIECSHCKMLKEFR